MLKIQGLNHCNKYCNSINQFFNQFDCKINKLSKSRNLTGKIADLLKKSYKLKILILIFLD